MTSKRIVAVVGLGYVGLPLAAAFGKHTSTIGYDIDRDRIRELKSGHDRLGESPEGSFTSSLLSFTDDPNQLNRADIFIVTVPTPVDEAKTPDLTPIRRATETVGRALAARRKEASGQVRPAPIVVYESTVYPGCTEEVCVPLLEQTSGLRWKNDFYVGYSPERINPGDAEHSLANVVKIVSGDTDETCRHLADTYSLVATRGIHRAPSIKVAEAAKVIENIQRDINIALMNELAVLFKRLGVDTKEVIEAASTKWNFIRFEPGLVGGHCIPVDPYYLTYKAQMLGYHPEVILSGRRINDSMPGYIAGQIVRQMLLSGQRPLDQAVLLLGITFKENIKDVRSSGAVALARELGRFGLKVHVYDPLVGSAKIEELGLAPAADPFSASPSKFGAVVLAVPHREFLAIGIDRYVELLGPGASAKGVLVDVKGKLKLPDEVAARLVYWSLQ